MLRRAIAQPALPDCPKIPDPGEICGLIKSRRTGETPTPMRRITTKVIRDGLSRDLFTWRDLCQCWIKPEAPSVGGEQQLASVRKQGDNS
jgi:hypothetical protein